MFCCFYLPLRNDRVAPVDDTLALLKGLLFGANSTVFSPTHTRKAGWLYRYYVSQTVLKHGA